MNVKNGLLLLLLSSVWGASFLFMRVGAVEFGPIALIFLRMSISLAVLLPILRPSNYLVSLKNNWRHFLILGFTNNVVPFVLLSYALLSLESGFTSLINATTPMFTTLVAVMFFGTKIRPSQIMGLIIAFCGIYVLSADKLSFSNTTALWSIAAGLVATVSYGFAANYAKNYMAHLTSNEITTGTMTASTSMLLIPAVVFWPVTNPSSDAWIAATLLAVVSTGFAFLIYYRLIAAAGVVFTSSVTFLVPIFAITWGAMLLGEQITLQLVTGMLITLFGTGLVIKVWPQKLKPETS